MDESQTPAGSGRDQQKRVQVLRIARAIMAMLGDLDAPFDLDALARTAAISRFHFVRQFRALTGYAPQDFHRRLRLQRAAWSLISRTDAIVAIALAAGFDTSDGFARAFRRMYGVPPTTFRRLGADPWSGFSRFGYWRPQTFDNHPAATGETTMELRQLPAMIYAGVRSVGPYNAVGPAFERIVGWAAGAGLMTPATRVLGLSWDDPGKVSPDRLRYDAAITLLRPVETPDDIHIAALPAMTWAMTTHKGSYATMSESFKGIGKAIGERSDLIHVPMCGIEIYLNDPDNTPEADLRTDIGMAIVQAPVGA